MRVHVLNHLVPTSIASNTVGIELIQPDDSVWPSRQWQSSHEASLEARDRSKPVPVKIQE
jgi:hypothetical protein